MWALILYIQSRGAGHDTANTDKTSWQVVPNWIQQPWEKLQTIPQYGRYETLYLYNDTVKIIIQICTKDRINNQLLHSWKLHWPINLPGAPAIVLIISSKIQGFFYQYTSNRLTNTFVVQHNYGNYPQIQSKCNFYALYKTMHDSPEMLLWRTAKTRPRVCDFNLLGYSTIDK